MRSSGMRRMAVGRKGKVFDGTLTGVGLAGTARDAHLEREGGPSRRRWQIGPWPICLIEVGRGADNVCVCCLISDDWV